MERASWVFNQLFLSGTTNTTQCNSVGGIIQTPVPSTSIPNDCEIFLRQAGPDGLGTVTFTPLPSSNPTKNNGGHTNNRSLTSASKAGIGVSVVVITLLLLAMIATYIRFQKKKKISLPPEREEFQKAELPDSEIAKSPSSARQQRPEIGGGQMIEIDGSEKIELDASDQVEIDGYQTLEIDGTEMKRMVWDDIIHELPANERVNEDKATVDQKS
jgi:hypothetical protein